MQTKVFLACSLLLVLTSALGMAQSQNVGAVGRGVSISFQNASGSADRGVSVGFHDAAGTIQVTSNVTGAAYTLKGPATYSGNGSSFTQTNAPEGVYTITYSSVPCYNTPQPQSLTLVAGGSVNFNGAYQPAANVSVNIAPAAATSATFSISPPIPGMRNTGPYPVNQSSVVPQSYTVTFNPVGGFATPAPQTVAPSQSCALAFTGTYAPAQPTSTATLSVTFKLTDGGVRGGFAVYNSGSTVPLATGTPSSPTVTLPAPATYTVKYDALAGYNPAGFNAPPSQTVALNPGDSLTLVALYRRLIVIGFTGFDDAPETPVFPIPPPWNCPLDPGAGFQYVVTGSTSAPGMVTLLNEIQQPSSGLSADVAAFTFYSSGIPGSNACSSANLDPISSQSPHVEASNWFNSQNVSHDDLIGVVGHSYGGNRARQFVDFLTLQGFRPDFLATVDPVDWTFCDYSSVLFSIGPNTECLQSPPASGSYTDAQKPRAHSAKTAESFYQPWGYKLFSVKDVPIVYPITGYTLTPATVTMMASDFHGDIDSDAAVHSAIRTGLSKIVNTTPASSTSVSVVPGTGQRVNGNISIPIKLSVAGSGTAYGSTVTVGTLNGVAASGTPIQIGDIPAGTSSGVTNLVFPGSAAAAGATVQLTVTGRYSYYSQQQFSSTLRIKVP